jgi:O-antigen ligase
MSMPVAATRIVRAAGGRRDLTDGGLRELVYRLLCLYWFLLPWEAVFRIGGSATLAKGVGGIVFLAALVALVRTGRRSPVGDFPVLLIAFGTWVALSSFWTFTPGPTKGRIETMAELVLSGLITWEFARTRRRVRGLLKAWLLGCVVVAGIIVFLWLTGQGESRYAAPGTRPGDQAYAMLVAIPMAWYLSLTVRVRWQVVLYRLYVPVACLAVVLTASRAALLSMVFALLIVPLTAPRLTARARAAVGFAVVVLIGAAAVLAPELAAPIARLSTTSSEISGGTLDHRTELWSIAFHLIGQHPIVGIGSGGAQSAVGADFIQDRGLHDTFLSITVELGLVGIALFLLLGLAACYRCLTRLPPLETRFAWVLLVEFVISLVPRHDDYDKGTYALLALFAVMGTAFARRTVVERRTIGQETGPTPAAIRPASAVVAASAV